MIIRTLVPATGRCRSCVWYATAHGTSDEDLAELKYWAQDHWDRKRHVVEVDLHRRLTYGDEQIAKAAL
jgi:hypothetical protein